MRKFLLMFFSICLGLTFWTVTFAQDIERKGPARQPVIETAQPVPGATPTIDRLAAPPTVPAPNQADEGAQLFWLHCQPCHGDQGQGLTDEWRAQYPIDDQNCWNSGCHGERPYDPAFALPTTVPAVIGEGTLSKFQTADNLYRYISVAMPYFFPGDLTEAEYLAISAYLAREHGTWDGIPLTTETAINYPLRPAAIVPAQASPDPSPIPESNNERTSGLAIGSNEMIITVLWLGGLLLVGGIVLWRKSR